MVDRNPACAALHASYLFHEIRLRKEAYLAANPHAQIIDLGLGDTTQPLIPPVVDGLIAQAEALGTAEGYTGYEGSRGKRALRQRIAEAIYNNKVSAEDIYVSDGAKCDVGRLQLLFPTDTIVALQDPTYPAYLGTTILSGKGGPWSAQLGCYEGIIYLPCVPQNDFFPDLTAAAGVDVIFFCSPNNPTGVAVTHSQLEKLIDYAKRQKAIILYDAAYSAYIRDPSLPRSIYEIEGAREVAIEINSFSKMAGFTGVRLGWCVVPEQLRFSDGVPLRQDWEQIISTFFNGPSNVVQEGAMAALSPQGLEFLKKQIDHYLDNAALLHQALTAQGLACHGGKHAPFLWVEMQGIDSWSLFDRMLNEVQIIATPGAGFGPSGEGFMRFSGLAKRESILEAVERLKSFKI